jgi:hypothetical protein
MLMETNGKWGLVKEFAAANTAFPVIKLIDVQYL